MTDMPGNDPEFHRDLESLARDYRRVATGAPPAAIDTAILEHARQAAARRRRVPAWWVPAALAATVVVAFSLVMRIQQESAAPAAIEEVAAPISRGPDGAPVGAAILPRETELAPRPDVPPTPAESPQAAGSARKESAPPRPVEDARPAATAAARSPQSADDTGGPVRRDHTAPASPGASAAAATMRAPAAAMRVQASAEADALPSPEAWLARIEALESAGRLDEAAIERERLEEAYPGWLAQQALARD